MIAAFAAIASGGIVAMPLVRWARREAVAARVRPLASTRRLASGSAVRDGLRAQPGRVLGAAGRVLGAPRARRRARQRAIAIERELPVAVDLIRVALSAGCTPYLAIEHAARFGPVRTGAALHEVVRACRLGQSLDDALRDLGASVAVLRPLADALRTNARLGSPSAPALARLASEIRLDGRRRAEARARTVPVRLCFPLVACVLPAFALLTVAPAVLGGGRG